MDARKQRMRKRGSAEVRKRESVEELTLAAANRGGCASGLLWGVEPHGFPIGEQWGGLNAGLPHLLVAMAGFRAEELRSGASRVLLLCG